MSTYSYLNRFKTIFYTKSIFFISIACLFWVLSSCEKKTTPTPTVTVTAGAYKFVSATLVSDPKIVGLKTGQDVSMKVGIALFAVHHCDDTKNFRVDLRKNNELYFTCGSKENKEKKAGTWELTEKNTKLKFNLATPPFPSAFSVVIEDFKTTSSSIEGNSTLPIPRWLAEGIAPPANPTDFTNPKNLPVQNFKVKLKFEK